jgi:hypothetical protein
MIKDSNTNTMKVLIIDHTDPVLGKYKVLGRIEQNLLNSAVLDLNYYMTMYIG